MRDRLSAAGIKASTERVKTGKGDVFRVRVGPFSSREAADVARNRVNAAGFSSSIVPL
jgi:DedD protein